MRIIPRKTKLGITVYRSFTLIDLGILIVAFGLAILLVLSNLSIKWYLVVVLMGLTIVFMFNNGDDERMYYDLIAMFKYVAGRKKFAGKRAKDLVPFEDIDDSGIVDYGDYFGAVLNIGSIEFSLLETYEQNMMITSVAKAFESINLTTVLQLVKIDRPINYDEVSAILFHKLDMAEKEYPRNEAKIAILKSRIDQIDALNNITQQYRPFYYIVVYENTKEILMKTMRVIQETIADAGLECTTMDKTDTAIFFKYCYTRNFDERKIGEFEGTFEDYVKPSEVKFNVSSVESDGVYSFTYAISDYPLEVANAWGAELFNIGNTKVVMTIRPVEKSKAIKRIDNAIIEMGVRQKTKTSQILDQQTHLESLGVLLQSLKQENETLLDCTLTITGFNNTQEENAAFRKEITRKIRSCGFTVNLLRGRQLDGYITAGISRRSTLKRYERGINSESLAAVFPFVFTSTLEPNGVAIGYDYYPIILDIWKRGEQYTNSNIVCIGKSGAGKSYFTSSLVTTLQSDNVYAYIFDPENEYNILCENMGGKFIDVGNAGEGRINPLQIYQILTDEGEQAAPEMVYSAHLRLLEDFFRITMQGIAQDSLEELNNLVGKVYAKKGILPTTDISALNADDFPVFDDLLQVVEEELAIEKQSMRFDNLTRVKMYLKKFADGGRYAQLWNGASTLSSDERFCVFNFQSLFESKNTVVVNAQMLLFLRYLEQKIINIRELNNNQGADIHPLVVIDEGYSFIDPSYPIALDFIRSWFKRIRKYNGAMMFLTQNLSDILGKAEIIDKTSAIINNSQYSFIFGLQPADIEALSNLYRLSGGINDTERNAIATAKCGDCFAVLSSRQRTTFHVETSDVVEALFKDRGALQAVMTAQAKNID
ncbi:MAG: hypothetical protein NC132_06540 [Corallococcus sp.]|nr:hypothetical protein [Corallococcus sp.]MCM1395742.1 hypothetical protein [Corallococcus sp.]